MTLFAVPLGVAAAAVALRSWLLHAEWALRHHEPFEGVVYRVGEAAVAERRCEEPVATVIGVHGFLEDMRHFVGHYRDPRVQLILLNGGGYHLPVTAPELRDPPWAREPEHPHASIAYDAAVLVQALEHLPRSRRIRVHGHSRGGAVVLEAAALRPDLFRDVEVVLEAPVLPGGRIHRGPSALEVWAFPLAVPLWRLQPTHPLVTRGLGPMHDPRKRALVSAFPFSTRRIRTMVAAIRDLEAWMRQRDHGLYANVRGVVLVPGRDRILDVASMRASAQRAAGQLDLREVADCSHFVLLDRPEALPPLRS